MMKLYRVAPLPDPELLIVAPTTTEAADIFVTYCAARRGIQVPKLVIEEFERLLTGEFRLGLDEMLASGAVGIARRNDRLGWSVEPPS